MNYYGLVIFDLDGVLVDACEWHRIALNEALCEICNYEISMSDHVQEFNGIPTRIKLKKLINMGILPEEDLDTVYDTKQRKTIDIINREAKIRYEKIALINMLKSKNIRVGCFTNSIRETANLMLEKTGVLDLLDLVITNQDVENPKPHPEGYIAMLDHFNISPKNSIIVEDSPKGVEAAILSGCKVLVVRNSDEVNIDLFKGIIL